MDCRHARIFANVRMESHTESRRSRESSVPRSGAKPLDGEGACQQTSPKNEIVTDKIRHLGMEFGGLKLLEETVQRLVKAVKEVG